MLSILFKVDPNAKFNENTTVKEMIEDNRIKGYVFRMENELVVQDKEELIEFLESVITDVRKGIVDGPLYKKENPFNNGDYWHLEEYDKE